MTNLAYQNDTPGIGHNAPPVGDPFPGIKARTDDLVKAADQWLIAVPQITDQETAEACDSLLTQLRAEKQAADAARKAWNDPHDKAIKANNERFKTVTVLLEKCEAFLKPLKAGWLKREDERIAREKAEAEAAALRAIEEAEAAKRAVAEATAPTVEAVVEADRAAQTAEQKIAAYQAAAAAKPVVKGGLSARSSGLRQYWFAKIHDYQKALHHYSHRQEVKDLVQQLANADARAQKSLLRVPGIEAKMEERV